MATKRKAATSGPNPQGDLTLIQITQQFATEEAAREYFEKLRWPNGPVCAHCGNADQARIYKVTANRAKKIRPGQYKCAECARSFTVTVGTVCEDSHIPLNKWLIAFYMMCASKTQVSALQLQRQLEIGSYRSAWFLCHRIRFALQDILPSDKLSGTVEADETYVGGVKHGMGRPRHITELCALLANASKDSKVLDICAGTGGFLISAMHRMFKSAVTEKDKARIKKDALVGVEQQPNMFALAASNMMLRGDGKANLHQSSCFDEAVTDAIKAYRCDVGLLNPPYSQGDEDLHELYFVGHMMNCLRKGGIGIAVVPMNCAISPHKARGELLKNHTLEAVMSLPDLLFTPVGVITCLMVFTAKIPHEASNKKTWFGYWKDDGFVKTKHLGRVDLYGRWPAIRERWVETFRNREIVPGESVLRRVTADDEWCAEAYMKTDYSTLSPSDFDTEIKKYVAFRILQGEAGSD